MTLAAQIGRAVIEKETANAAREFIHVARRLAKNQGNPELAAAEASRERALPRIQECLKSASVAGSHDRMGSAISDLPATSR
jgi:hypothetical protein